MKKKEIIKRVLRSHRNTVFTTEGQVENTLEVLEGLGVLNKRKSDKKRLIQLLEEFGVDYRIYSSPIFIIDKARKLGATESICIRDSVDLEFDKNGNCIGSSTDAAKSFRKRKS